jgi:hypothetical protein
MFDERLRKTAGPIRLDFERVFFEPEPLWRTQRWAAAGTSLPALC